MENNQVDYEYCRLLEDIMEFGRRKKNRTGVDTIGIFGQMAKFDVRLDAFPILTTKKVWFKGIVHELLWFIRGETNIKYLVDHDVHIWDEWAYAKFKKNSVFGDKDYRHEVQSQEAFIKDIKRLPRDDWFVNHFGELGQGTYGGMWRQFPFWYGGYSDWADNNPFITWTKNDFEFGVDQLAKVIDKLKTNPDDRRIIVSAWHPYWVDHCALPPCHCLFHFNTEELTENERFIYANETLILSESPEFFEVKTDEEITSWLDKLNVPRRRLNLLLYQRSCDTFLGVPFNITSYALLLAMVAHCVDMAPGVFTHFYGDLHIYENHLDQVQMQLHRPPMKLPSLRLNPKVKNLFDFKYEDITLVDYVSHPKIEAPIAV